MTPDSPAVPARGLKLSIIVPLAAGDRPAAGLLRLGAGRQDVETLVSAVDARPADLDDSIGWLTGPPGRGRQLNHGVREASGRWLWLIHADSSLPADAVETVLAFVRDPEDRIGYCRLKFLGDGPRLTALNALGAGLRSRLLGLPYGDQGLCLPARCCDRLGGFREDLERGEDLDFILRARTAGIPVRPMPLTLFTSARRYRRQGWLRTTAAHQLAAWRLARDARRRVRESQR